jgi:hypothetical protein
MLERLALTTVRDDVGISRVKFEDTLNLIEWRSIGQSVAGFGLRGFVCRKLDPLQPEACVAKSIRNQSRRITVKAFRMLCFVAAMSVSMMVFGQDQAKQSMKMGSKEWAELEKTLWDVDQQWLCSAGATPYHKDYKECVEFRSKFWTDQFFEVSIKGEVQTKAEMIAKQRVAHPSKGVGPHPDGFKLMAVYGNFALATDHTFLQSESKDGKVAGTETRVLRMFAKEDGKWRPAGAALVPIIP